MIKEDNSCMREMLMQFLDRYLERYALSYSGDNDLIPRECILKEDDCRTREIMIILSRVFRDYDLERCLSYLGNNDQGR